MYKAEAEDRREDRSSWRPRPPCDTPLRRRRRRPPATLSPSVAAATGKVPHRRRDELVFLLRNTMCSCIWRCRLPSSLWLKPHETHLRKCWLKYIVILLIRSIFLCFALLLLNALINMRSKSTSYLLTKLDRGFAVLLRQCECLARWKGK